VGNIVVTEFLSLDGVMEAPEKWSSKYWNDEIAGFKDQELRSSDAHLLGRVTYDLFAGSWPSRSGEFADRFNSLPKYVVSTTLKDATWKGSHIIRGKVAEEVAKLRSKHSGDIVVAGSAQLANALLDHDLVDELRLLVYPVLLGGGKRLFAGGMKKTLKLAETAKFGADVALLRYRKAA
jgi:dihydrofolate reductase